MPPSRANEDKIWVDDLKVMPDPQPYDIVIPILGITGSGKSTLVNALLNSAKFSVGDDLDSCTRDVQFVAVVHPQTPTYRIILLDTPGLNSIEAPDQKILERVVSWLRKSYGENMKLAGVIFLHEIPQARDFSLARSNLDKFDSLCGNGATKNVILATTKWSSPPKGSELQKETELQSPIHWGQLIRRGLRMCRFDEVSYDAAWKLVNLSLADAFTFDTEKIKEDVEGVRQSLKKKGDGQRLIITLEELLVSQNNMALEMKQGDGRTDVLWNKLVENDRRIRDTLSQINSKVPLSQRVKAFFKLSRPL